MAKTSIQTIELAPAAQGTALKPFAQKNRPDFNGE